MWFNHEDDAFLARSLSWQSQVLGMHEELVTGRHVGLGPGCSVTLTAGVQISQGLCCRIA
jgi:hypothetical protein